MCPWLLFDRCGIEGDVLDLFAKLMQASVILGFHPNPCVTLHRPCDMRRYWQAARVKRLCEVPRAGAASPRSGSNSRNSGSPLSQSWAINNWQSLGTSTADRNRVFIFLASGDCERPAAVLASMSARARSNSSPRASSASLLKRRWRSLILTGTSLTAASNRASRRPESLPPSLLAGRMHTRPPEARFESGPARRRECRYAPVDTTRFQGPVRACPRDSDGRCQLPMARDSEGDRGNPAARPSRRYRRIQAASVVQRGRRACCHPRRGSRRHERRLGLCPT